MHPYLNIFSWQITSYGLMAIIGIVAALLFVVLKNRRSTPPLLAKDDLINLLAVIMVGVLLGSKLLYIITILPPLIRNWSAISSDWSFFLTLLTDGGVFYGGLLGGIIATQLYCKKYRVSVRNAAELFTCAIPLFHVFGRIGCFLAGCCYGKEWAHGIVFSNSTIAPNNIPLFPTQLFESGFNLVLFFLLLYLSSRLKQAWQIFPIYLVSYASMRFVLEFFRGDAIRGVWLLSTSQWISLSLLVVIIVWFYRYKKQPAKDIL